MNVEAETRFELEVATLTDVGTEREHNEDHCGELLENPACGLLVVADGVSSAEAGETASQTAVAATLRSFGEQPAGSPS
jgi:serine/threonine protein phosphatase PrpC